MGKKCYYTQEEVFLDSLDLDLKKSEAMLCYYDVILTKTKIQPFYV